MGEYPEGIDINPERNEIYVANWFDDNLIVINTQSLEIIDEIATGTGSRAFGRFIKFPNSP